MVTMVTIYEHFKQRQGAYNSENIMFLTQVYLFRHTNYIGSGLG